MALAARRGRPVKPATPGTKVSLGLKATAKIKTRLDADARRTGETQSQRAELRLTKSFELEDQLDQPLSLLAGGENQLTDLLRAIAKAMADVGLIAGTYSGVSKTERFRQGFWFDDAYAASKAIEAAHRVLDLFTPDASAVAKAEPRLLGEPAASLALAMLERLPKDKAKGAVERVLSDPHRPAMLGPTVRERVLHHLGHVRESAPATDMTEATTTRGETEKE
jgi:hypothetical protein